MCPPEARTGTRFSFLIIVVLNRKASFSAVAGLAQRLEAKGALTADGNGTVVWQLVGCLRDVPDDSRSAVLVKGYLSSMRIFMWYSEGFARPSPGGESREATNTLHRWSRYATRVVRIRSNARVRPGTCEERAAWMALYLAGQLKASNIIGSYLHGWRWGSKAPESTTLGTPRGDVVTTPCSMGYVHVSTPRCSPPRPWRSGFSGQCPL